MSIASETPAERIANQPAGPVLGRLRVAVIGAGKISEQHLAFLSSSPHTDLVAVCDRSPALGRFAAETYRTTAHTDVAAMLQSARPDVVHVLTPPQSHVPLAKLCMDAGAHVLVEKPVALTHAEFQDLWDFAQQRGRWLVEDQNYRFNRPVQVLRHWIDEGKLGSVHEVEVRMSLPLRGAGSRYGDQNLRHPSHSLPAGVLHEFISHLVYLVLYLLPPDFEPSRIAAAWSNHGDDALFRFDDLDALMIDGPVHARLRIDAQAAPSGFCLVARGSKGWAETDLFQPYLRRIASRGFGQLDPMANHLANGLNFMKSSVTVFWDKIMQRTAYEGLAVFLEATYQALRQGEAPPIGYPEMARTSRLIEALLDEEHRV